MALNNINSLGGGTYFVAWPPRYPFIKIKARSGFYFYERVRGFEPLQTAWKAVVLPLHHTRMYGQIVHKS